MYRFTCPQGPYLKIWRNTPRFSGWSMVCHHFSDQSYHEGMLEGYIPCSATQSQMHEVSMNVTVFGLHGFTS